MYSGTPPCGHPTYVDTMLLWTLFLQPVSGFHSLISFTTVDTPQFWTLFVWPSVVHISEVLYVINDSIEFENAARDIWAKLYTQKQFSRS